MEEQRKRKLLVVEDEIYLQRQIKAMLTERGYEVETASSRAEAVPPEEYEAGHFPDRLRRRRICGKGTGPGRRRLCVKAVPDGGTALADPGKLKKKRKSAVRCDEEWTDPSGYACQYSTERWKRSQLKLD